MYLGSIFVYPLWSSTVAGLWYPRSCVAAQHSSVFNHTVRPAIFALGLCALEVSTFLVLRSLSEDLVV